MNYIIMIILLTQISTILSLNGNDTTSEGISINSANIDPFMITYQEEINSLAERLTEKDIPTDWFYDNLSRENFSFYENIGTYFHNMAETRVSRGEIDTTEYKRHFGVDRKVQMGRKFIDEHLDLLQTVQEKNGIHYELVVAILGMETNFAQQRQRGNFNVFDALVSQYLLLPNRRRFAVNELAALYQFSNKIDKEIDYFLGSFAGASGWGQFIPTSLLAYFTSVDGVSVNTDIYSIEDTLVSIDNYLAAHNLNRNTINSEDHRQRAVFAYNRSSAYVEAVLYMYEEFKRMKNP